MYNWTEIINCIKKYDEIAILTHTNMDGDAIGSSLALCLALRKMAKKAVILLEDAIPGYLSIMLPKEEQDALPYFVSSMPYEAKLAIAVDCGDESRIEKRVDVFKGADKRICIDHHLQKEVFADYSVVDPNTAATGMLIFELLKAMDVKIDTQIAEELYVAIATDTGRFKYSNTTAYVHMLTAELYAYNIDHVKICNAVFDTYPPAQLKAESLAIENMKIFAEGKGVISSITQKEMQEIGAGYDQIDTCIDRIRLVEGTEMSAFLKEKEAGLIKVSFRAKSYSDANAVASAVGGGGHVKAAGATLHMSLDEAKALVQSEIEKELKKY